jgi:NAD(P) transhydrogenase subunit alpha
MKVAVVRETFPGERRVALVPAAIPALVKSGLEILVEASAGSAAGFADDDYRAAGARIVSRDEAFAADCVLCVRTCGACGAGW